MSILVFGSPRTIFSALSSLFLWCLCFIFYPGAYEVGITEKQFQDSLSELVDRVRIGYAYDTNEVCILNWLKYNGSDSPTWSKAVEDSLQFVKSKELRDLALRENTVSIPYAYGIHTLPNRERDRERDRDTSKGEKYRMPTVSSDVYEYAESIGISNQEADAWFDYHEARGWTKMKHTERSVQASLRTWKRYRKIFAQEPVQPTANEVGSYALSLWPNQPDGTNPQLRFAQDYYQYNQQQGWKMANGNPITDWQTGLRAYVNRQMAKL